MTKSKPKTKESEAIKSQSSKRASSEAMSFDEVVDSDDEFNSITYVEPRMGTKEYAEWISNYLKPRNKKRIITQAVDQIIENSSISSIRQLHGEQAQEKENLSFSDGSASARESESIKSHNSKIDYNSIFTQAVGLLRADESPNQLIIEIPLPLTNKPFNCEDFNFASKSIGNFNVQKVTLKEGKPFKCDLCNYATTQSSYLKTHKLTHTGEKPFKCDLCNYASITSSNLNTHKLSHTGEKPFKCDLCNYATTRSSNLNTHKLSHTGGKSFKCDLCNYATTRSTYLKTHKLSHTAEKTFKCDLCNYAATHSGHLKIHFNLKLKEDKAPTGKCYFDDEYEGLVETF